MRILILGAGFGGLELAATLSETPGSGADVTLIDRADGFVFGFSKLDVMFGRALPAQVIHPYASLVKPNVRFVQATITSIDPVNRACDTDSGRFEAEIMVVALGADLRPELTPGLIEDGYEFYTVDGAFALRDVLAGFRGGRVVVGVTSTPFKCPPAPSETALLMHDFLSERGLRDVSEISLVMPLGAPIPPAPDASKALLRAFAERGIKWGPNQLITSLDPERHAVVTSDGAEIPYDLFLGVPVHRAPDVVLDSGMSVDGWIPVNPMTLETEFPDVYAVGDVTSVGTPKAGVFAEGQAAVVARAIVDRARGLRPERAYDGRGVCYVEFGRDQVAKVDVTFVPGQAPSGGFDGPSLAIAVDKTEFGASRIRKWFGRQWRSPVASGLHDRGP